MQLISKYSKGIRYLLCAIDLFSKYAWVAPLKDKKYKIWIDQNSEFYNNLFKKFLKENNIDMYSTYNERKSVVAERFIKTLKDKIFKHMIAVSKNVYFHVLDDIVDSCNNTFHKIIGMKPIDIKSDSYAEDNVDSNEKDPKFKVGDRVKISK